MKSFDSRDVRFKTISAFLTVLMIVTLMGPAPVSFAAELAENPQGQLVPVISLEGSQEKMPDFEEIPSGSIDEGTALSSFSSEPEDDSKRPGPGDLIHTRLTEAEKKQVKNILNQKAISKTVEITSTDRFKITKDTFYDDENRVVGSRTIEKALHSNNPIQKRETWSDVNQAVVLMNTTLLDGTQFSQDGRGRKIRLTTPLKKEPLVQLIVDYKEGVPSKATVRRYDSDGTLNRIETYTMLTELKDHETTCPIGAPSEEQCSTIAMDYGMPAGEAVGFYKTITEGNGLSVTSHFVLFGVISNINFVKDHKIQYYTDGILSKVTIHLDPNPPFKCPKGEVCIQPEPNPFITSLTVNFREGKAFSATLVQKFSNGTPNFTKNFESMEAFKVSEGTCPTVGDGPCVAEVFPSSVPESAAKDKIASFDIHTLGVNAITVTRYDFWGLLTRMTEPNRVQEFTAFENARVHTRVTETSQDGKTRIVVNFKNGTASDARVETLENKKIVQTDFYKPVLAQIATIATCPTDPRVGAPCEMTVSRPTNPPEHYSLAGPFSTREVAGAFETTTTYSLFGIKTETRFADANRTRLLYGAVGGERKTWEVTSLIVTINKSPVRVNFYTEPMGYHGVPEHKPDWEVIRAALLTAATPDILKASPLNLSNYQHKPSESLCSAGALIGNVVHSTCVTAYTFDLSNKNKKITAGYLAKVIETTPAGTKEILVTQIYRGVEIPN